MINNFINYTLYFIVSITTILGLYVAPYKVLSLGSATLLVLLTIYGIQPNKVSPKIKKFIGKNLNTRTKYILSFALLILILIFSVARQKN